MVSGWTAGMASAFYGGGGNLKGLTSWYHFSALGGMLYCLACSERSSISLGKTSSNSARVTGMMMEVSGSNGSVIAGWRRIWRLRRINSWGSKEERGKEAFV